MLFYLSFFLLKLSMLLDVLLLKILENGFMTSVVEVFLLIPPIGYKVAHLEKGEN